MVNNTIAKLLVTPALAAMLLTAAVAAEDSPAAAAPADTVTAPDPQSAEAEQAPTGVHMELNKVETVDQACRAYLVVTNHSEQDFESLKLDTVMFDSDGVVAKRLAVQTAPLPAGKTSLKVFDISDLACTNISRILLNDVLACRANDEERDDCLGLVSVSGRGSVPFIK